MCRLFGFRSVILSQVHHSLVHAENALEVQSNLHQDGWGVAYYVGGSPHIIKSDKTAINDVIFKKVSGVVSSQTVLAHIRKATLGEINILNTHPFQYGRWTFAHNGNIKNFDKHRPELLSRISPTLKRFILGTTDSELLFFFVLSKLAQQHDLQEPFCSIEKLNSAIKESVEDICKVVGQFNPVDKSGNSDTYLTFIITDGLTMAAHQGGKELYYSTYKNRCPERDTCPSFAPECEAPSKNGQINHLIFSSEPLSGENIWLPIRPGQVIGVGPNMRLLQS